jgi:hypothetical protein
MTKQELRSLIKNLLPKYSQGAEYHNEVIDRAIEDVIKQLYLETFARAPLSIQRYTKRFGTTSPITVSYDSNAGLYYSSYSSLGSGVMPLSLPDKASGVRRVATVAQAGVKFYPMDIRELELVADSYFSTVTDKIGYVVTQDRVEYFGMTAAIANAGVRMDCIIGFSDYADTDQILIPDIPEGQTNDGKTFEFRVLTTLGVVRPQETKDDNITTPPQTEK